MYLNLSKTHTTLSAQCSAAATSATATDGSILVGLRTDVDRVPLIFEDPNDADSFEIVMCTQRSGNTLTIERGKEGSADQTWPADTVVRVSNPGLLIDEMLTPWPIPLHQRFPGDQYNSSNSFWRAQVIQEQVVLGRIVDLATGGPDAWAASTSYSRGATVKPTSPTGSEQFYLYIPYGKDVSSITSDASEPTWPTGNASIVAANADAEGDCFWVHSMHSSGYQQTDIIGGGRLIPTSVGFICHQYSGLTVQPTLSFGRSSNPTEWINSTITTGITGAQSIHEYTSLAGTEGEDSLRMTLDTVATGTYCRGRPFFKGYCIEF